MDAFQYQPLDTGQFRLLTLHCSDREGPIIYRLEHQLFGGIPNSWALSYVWNQKSLDVPTHTSLENLIINSKPSAVKWNLISALQHIREYADSDRTL